MGHQSCGIRASDDRHAHWHDCIDFTDDFFRTVVIRAQKQSAPRAGNEH